MAQQTAIELLLSKIPDAAEIKAFISNNDADEKMLDEWLWERIYKGVDYKQMEKEQIVEAATRWKGTDFAEQYYNETYGKPNSEENA